MAVRFLPNADDRPAGHGQAAAHHQGRELAEVISLRSRLVTPAEADSSEVADTHETGSVAAAADAPGIGDALQVEVEVEVEVEAEAIERDAARIELREFAVRALARRSRTRFELRAELLAHEYGLDDIEMLLDEFEESRYLDDLGLARIVTEKLRSTKRASRTQIRRKLAERGFASEAIEIVVGELDDEEEHTLLQQAASDRARRLTGVDRATAERRLLGFLARRGWGGEPAFRAVREALDEHGTGGPVQFR